MKRGEKQRPDRRWREKGGGPGAKGGKGSKQSEGLRHPFAEALQLTDEQKAKAKELLEAAQPKIEAIREEQRAKIKAVVDDSLKELRPMLSPQQQAVFDDLQKLQADKAALKNAQRPAAAEKPANL
jgi:Spy/CpxP family protein refolding chaperone